jgi:protein-S-isoprenylcysteine O-methyltransferase Ste14
MSRSLVRAILILPGTVAVLVPGLLVLAARGTRWAGAAPRLDSPAFWGALPLLAFGVSFVVATVRLFVRHGEGTPAPWDPPRKSVVRGTYRHVRNPMIAGVLLVLMGEALLLRCWPLGGWMALFFLANALYFPLRELTGRVLTKSRRDFVNTLGG